MTHIALVDRVSDLAPPVVAEMLQRARALEGDGASLVSLVRGEPDFATLPHLPRGNRCHRAGKDALSTEYGTPRALYGGRREAGAGKWARC